WKVGQRFVLLAIHEHLPAWQAEKLLHQLTVVGKIDHRPEDPWHRRGADLMAQAGRVQRAGIRRCVAGPFDEVVEEPLRVFAWMVEDLSAEETVLGRNVALDVDEVEYTL